MSYHTHNVALRLCLVGLCLNSLLLDTFRIVNGHSVTKVQIVNENGTPTLIVNRMSRIGFRKPISIEEYLYCRCVENKGSWLWVHVKRHSTSSYSPCWQHDFGSLSKRQLKPGKSKIQRTV